MCFIGGFSAFRTITIIGTLGILLNAIYFLRAYQYVFFGKLNEKYESLTDMNAREIGIIIPLAILVIVFGVYPSPLLDLIHPTMDSLIDLIQGSSQFIGMK